VGEFQGQVGRDQEIWQPSGFDAEIVQVLASHYTDWVIPAAENENMVSKIEGKNQILC
jgi:hypothetical protein